MVSSALAALTSIRGHPPHRTPDRDISKLSYLLKWSSNRLTLHQLHTTSQSSILAKYCGSCPSFPQIGILYLNSTPEISCNIHLFEGIGIQKLKTSIFSKGISNLYVIKLLSLSSNQLEYICEAGNFRSSNPLDAPHIILEVPESKDEVIELVSSLFCLSTHAHKHCQRLPNDIATYLYQLDPEAAATFFDVRHLNFICLIKREEDTPDPPGIYEHLLIKRTGQQIEIGHRHPGPIRKGVVLGDEWLPPDVYRLALDSKIIQSVHICRYNAISISKTRQRQRDWTEQAGTRWAQKLLHEAKQVSPEESHEIKWTKPEGEEDYGEDDGLCCWECAKLTHNFSGCKRCRIAAYCGTECERYDRKEHKAECRVFKRASVAARRSLRKSRKST
jgi:MYND finger